MDDTGLPVQVTKDVGAKAAPEIEELGANFFERINKGYWCVFTNSYLLRVLPCTDRGGLGSSNTFPRDARTAVLWLRIGRLSIIFI